MWRSLARFVEYGPVEMGPSTAVWNTAGTHNLFEQGVPRANLSVVTVSNALDFATHHC